MTQDPLTPHPLYESASGALAWVGELRRRGWELAQELDFPPQTVDMEFLNFLRVHSRFGFFIFGPVAIDLHIVEDVFYRTAPRGTGGPDHPPLGDDYVRFTRTLMEEARRTERNETTELTYLLAFMRTSEGLPGRVFGELGVTPEAVERYAADLSAGRSQTSASPERLLSTEEAAEYYGVHVQTVRGWIRAGKLPASRLAGQKSIRIRESDLRKVLEPIGPDAAPE